jgi:hypothetical protein
MEAPAWTPVDRLAADSLVPADSVPAVAPTAGVARVVPDDARDGRVLQGTAIDAAIIGTLTAVALWIVGLDVGVPLALLAAAGEFVPYIGVGTDRIIAMAFVGFFLSRYLAAYQYTRLDSRQAENALLSTMAFGGDE